MILRMIDLRYGNIAYDVAKGCWSCDLANMACIIAWLGWRPGGICAYKNSFIQ
jgi:hypothetical protein